MLVLLLPVFLVYSFFDITYAIGVYSVIKLQ